MTPLDQVVRTKIVPPQRRAGLLRRPRLVDFLHENLTKKLILISAAPGYGKTSLLLDFVHDSEVGTSWYGLDASDADPWTFVEHLAASVIESFPQLGEGPLASHPRDPGAGAGPESLLRVLVNEIQENVPEFFAILMDDYHYVDASAEVGELLAWFLEHQPDNCCLVLATRTMPALPFLRLTARQEIAGLGSAELAFSAGEIQAYLEENHNVTLSGEEAEQLAQETEGWITAILLGTHTLWKGLMRSLAEAQGKDEQIFAYLAQEVFHQLPEETQSFLRSTSILKVLRPHFCNALLGIDDSEGILKRLEQGNLFVTKLASPRGAYRYHGLFQDFLVSMLETEARTERKALHRAAGRLLERENAWEEALEHYLTSGADEEAVAVLQRIMEPTFASGRLVTLAHWLAALNPRTLEADGELLVMRGRTHAAAGQLEEARAAFRRAAIAFERSGDAAGRLDVRVREALLHRLEGDYRKAKEICEQMLALADSDGIPRETLAAAHRILGECHHLSGRLAEAKREFRESLRLYEATGDHFYASMLLQNLGTTARRMGNPLEAEGHYASALRIAEQLGNLWRVAELKNQLGVGLFFQGEYEEAQSILEDALEDARGAGHARTEALILSSLGDLRLDLGNVREARRLYEASLAGAQESADAFLITYDLCALSNLYAL
ncbi:MAG: tetratricopeptide repeat protein, partial [Anaerolineae bacterium]